VLTVEQIRENYEAGLERARRYFMGDADVQRAAKRLAAATTSSSLIRANALPAAFGDALDPWVRDKFRELWGYAQIPVND